MKFLHLSDLHIGKRVNEFSMLEEQEYILNKILEIADSEKVESVIIAGDVYDKTVPATEAVQVFDRFLSELAARKLHVFIISGNHDSAERVAFGSKIMEYSNIHISPVYNGNISPVRISDSFGDIYVYMLPFVKPAHVRRFSDNEITCSNDAVRVAVEKMNVNPECRNILVAHQFVTGASLSGAEEFAVGGSDNVDADIFSIFDYVALGHIHRPQNVKGKKIRYCGSQLKYKADEVNQTKTVTIMELNEKNSLDVRTIPLVPKREMRVLKGSFMELTDKNFYRSTNTDDYIFITLTDEEDIPDAGRLLQQIYPHMMSLSYDNSRTRLKNVIKSSVRSENVPPLQLFSEFYEMQCGHGMSEKQKEFAETLINKVWEEEIS